MAGIKSLKRAFDILNLYMLGNTELGVSEIAQKLKIDMAAASRLMATLESANFLRRNPANRKYFLTGKVVKLANVCLTNLDLKAISIPYLEELNKKIKEAVGIHTIEGDKRFCLVWVDSPQPVRVVIDQELIYGPLHAGSPGKLLLAFLPDEEINKLIGRTGLPRYTEFTITSKKELLKEIEKIRRQGISISGGEHIESLNSVSAPVRNYTGKVIGAVSISWVKNPNDSELVKKYSILLKETAHGISHELGYQG